MVEQEIGVQGPTREHYIVSFADTDPSLHGTEICWPVFLTRWEGG